MEFKDIIFENKGSICEIKLNRPKVLNALVPSVFHEINEVMNEIDKDENVRIVIITGEGRSFAAGADIEFMRDMNSKDAKNFANEITAILRRMETSNKIFIAAVNGYALGGGCELALACDLRIAEEGSIFGLPEVSLGIIPGFSGTQRLPRLVGTTIAKGLIYTADKIDGTEAYRIGLVNKVCENGTLMEETYKMAERILKNGAIAVSYAKEAVSTGMQLDMDSAIDYEKNLFSLCFATEDQKEGMTAFCEKRKPEYKNR